MSSLLALFANLGASTSRSAASLGARGLQTTAPLQAVVKNKPVAKKKNSIKKSLGARSTGNKRKSGAAPSEADNRQNPFFQPLVAPKLPTLTPQACTKTQSIGTAHAWGKSVRDLIKTADLPRPLLKELSEQATPRTLIRSTTQHLAATLDAAAKPNAKAPRQLLLGPRGSGKSHLLLQSVAYALDKGWAVAYVPRCISLIDSTSPFAYAPAQQVYAQPLLLQNFARTLLVQECIADLPLLRTANTQHADQAAAVSPAAKTQRELALQAKTCGELAKVAAADSLAPAVRVAAVELLLRSLAAQTKFPFLLAIDDVQALYMRSAYRDADYAPLEAWEMSLPRSLLQLLRTDGPQRGAVVAATGESASEWMPSPAFLRAIDEKDPIHFKRRVPLNDYTPVDQTHLKHATEARWQKLTVPKLTQTEAKGLWELRRQEGGFWSNANDELYLLKLIESGGNIRIFERSLLQTTL